MMIRHTLRTSIPAWCARGNKSLGPLKTIDSDWPASRAYVILSDSLFPVLTHGFQVSASVLESAQPTVMSIFTHMLMHFTLANYQPNRKSGRQRQPHSSHHAPTFCVGPCPMFETNFSMAHFSERVQAEGIVRERG